MSETKTAAPGQALAPTGADTRVVARKTVALDARGPKLEDTSDVWAVAETMAVGMNLLKPAMSDNEKRQAVARFAARIIVGREAGLTTAQSVRGIYDVNGRPAWYVETLRGLLYSRGVVPTDDEEAIQLGIENEPAPSTPRKDWPDNVAGFATIRRVGWKKAKTVRFSVGDAKMAGLWNKSGPWQDYPKRQLQERAFGFWCRDYAADLTMNLPIEAEARDIVEIHERAALAPPAPQASGPGLLDAIDADDAPVEVAAEVVEPADAPAAEIPSKPAPFDAESALAELQAAIARRTSDDEAAQQLEAEVVRGLEMVDAADFDEAARRLRAHPVFGDAAAQPAQPALFDNTKPPRHVERGRGGKR